MSFRDEARRALESSAERSKQNQHLTLLQERRLELRGVVGVDGLLALLRDPAADRDRKDAVLLALLEERKGGAFSLLLVALFPALDRIYRARLRRGEDFDDVWGQVVGAFAEAVERYPTARRRSRVAANLEGDTMASLRRARCRDLRAGAAQEQLAAAVEPFVEEVGAVDPHEDEPRLTLADLSSVEQRTFDDDELKAAAKSVTPMLRKAHVVQADRALVLGVGLFDRKLGELAGELGLSREAAKKRHQRAIARIRAAFRLADDGIQVVPMSPKRPIETFSCRGENSRHVVGQASRGEADDQQAQGVEPEEGRAEPLEAAPRAVHAVQPDPAGAPRVRDPADDHPAAAALRGPGGGPHVPGGPDRQPQ